MKKILLMFMAVLMFSLSAFCQNSSVMMIGEACLRSSNILHVKTMLLNEGLTINKTSELNNATNVVFENNADNVSDKLFIVVDKYPNTKTLKEIKFIFTTGKFYRKWSSENRQWGYTYISSNDKYREVYSNGDGQFMGVNLNNKGWIELTFYKD